MTIKSAVQEITLEHRWRYGYRRVTAELRLRGMITNHKRVARIMREDNLLVVRRERFLSVPGFASRCRDISQFGWSDETVGAESIVDRRHHLCPAE